MENTFKTHFLDKLSKSDIALIKEKGPRVVFKDKLYEGIEFFEKTHEIFEREKGTLPINDKKTVKYCNYYIPSNTYIKLLTLGGEFEIKKYDEKNNLILTDVIHLPSIIIQQTKFWLGKDKDSKQIYQLNAKYCASIMAEIIGEPNYDLILPVSHSNQSFSEVIGVYLGGILSNYNEILFDSDFIQLTRKITKQSFLSHNRRKKNIEGGFRLKHTYTDKKILLIDDILTTGVTVLEYIKILSASNEVDSYVMFKTKNLTFEEDTEDIEYIFNIAPKISTRNFLNF